MIRVEGHKNLYRDEKSGAIINCDTTSYNSYLNMLQQKQLQKVLQPKKQQPKKPPQKAVQRKKRPRRKQRPRNSNNDFYKEPFGSFFIDNFN